MNKTLKIVIAIVVALILGIGIVFEAVLILPQQFDRLYLGELADKYQRLRSLDDEKKIIIVGGSSVAFGINSQLMENELGIPVVNFGLYGPLGTTLMMDLTRGHINEGDIIVLAPETDEQTMSMTFNGEATWECADSDFSLLFRIRSGNWGDMLGSFWTYAQKKYQFYLYGKPTTDGVYNHDSFNEYGDVIYTRDLPIMENWVDEDVPINLDTSIVEDEYIDYVNDYIDYCESQGATVYYSWPPMNALAIQQDTDGILQYATYIRENIHCQIISDITDYIMDAGFFYDTNYHVTDRGVTVHSVQLIQDLQNFIGDASLVHLDAPAPPDPTQSGASGEPGAMPLPKGRLDPNAPPAAQTDAAQETVAEVETEQTEDAAAVEDDTETVEATATPSPTPTPVVEETVGSSADAAYFLYESYNEGVLITGVTDEGKSMETLEVPWLIDGQKVISIGEYAFDGCDNLKTIYIQSNITRILQHGFDGCSRLTSIYIDNENGANILIPGIGLFDNVPAKCKVYIAQAYYGSFIADYFWANYLDRLTAVT